MMMKNMVPVYKSRVENNGRVVVGADGGQDTIVIHHDS
jgi:hypothetical protein